MTSKPLGDSSATERIVPSAAIHAVKQPRAALRSMADASRPACRIVRCTPHATTGGTSQLQGKEGSTQSPLGPYFEHGRYVFRQLDRIDAMPHRTVGDNVSQRRGGTIAH